jgi:hypothetical protein
MRILTEKLHFVIMREIIWGILKSVAEVIPQFDFDNCGHDCECHVELDSQLNCLE